MQRLHGREILDDPVSDVGQLGDSFAEVWAVNRFLGGLRSLQIHLRPWLGQRHLRVLDVAAGTGDVALALQRWAARRGSSVHLTLLDAHPQVLALARERSAEAPGTVVIGGDARQLPFADGQFDIALCNLALHHWDEAEAVQALRELDRVSRLGWVVSDLERHYAAYWFARGLAAWVWQNPITRHDGPLSVRRAYSASELRRLIRRAELPATVHRHVPFRLAAVCRRP